MSFSPGALDVTASLPLGRLTLTPVSLLSYTEFTKFTESSYTSYTSFYKVILSYTESYTKL